MKKVVKFFPFILLVIILVLIILFCDLLESDRYIKFQNYNYQQINFDIDYLNIDEQKMASIFLSANKNNVILAKWINDSYNEKIQNIYLSFSDCEELDSFINKNFNTKINNPVKNKKTCYASTVNGKTENLNQLSLIEDFLNNNNYNYYLIDNLIDQNGYIFGNYIVYYQNETDFNNFILDSAKILNQENSDNIISENSGIFSSNYRIIAVIIIIILISESLFYFIFQIFYCYQKAKNIGCMKMLGFSSIKICNNLMKKNMKYLFLFSLLCLLMIPIIIININIKYYVIILVLVSIYLLLTYVISYLAVFTIFKFSNTSSIIKQENISKKVNKISIIIKVILTIIFIITSTFLFSSFKNMLNNTKTYRNVEILNNYAVFSRFKLENSDFSNLANYNKFYKLIQEDNEINSFYADFSTYYYNTQTDLKYAIEAEENGEYYRIANVDKNYFSLEDNNIVIYEPVTMKKIKIENIKGEIFLIPTSKKEHIDNFKKFYKDTYSCDYEKHNYELNFKIYLYEDKKFNTYRLDENIQTITSPFFRIIDYNFPISYMETPIGLSIIGNGMSTSFKIDISSGKDNVYNILNKYIEECNLTKVIDYESLTSYKDYFSDKISGDYRMISIYIFIIVIISVAHVFITLQTISLFICSDQKNIAVKSMLGFNKFDLFNKIFNINIYFDVIGILLSFILLLIFDQLYIINFFLASLLFFILDEIVILLIIKFYKLKSIATTLKGEI